MKNLAFSSVLLFPLIVYFIMQFRIGPGETPYWLFGVIFLLLALFISVDLFSLSQRTYNKIKDILLWITIVVVLGSAFGSSIIVRHQTSPIYGTHDIIVQQEAAIRYLLDGRNPYKETYFGTPLEQWHYSETEINPALYHFVMEPTYLYFALPFYFTSNLVLGYFDGRIPLFFLFFSLFILAWVLEKDREKRRIFVILLALNPVMLPYTLEGRSDMFMYPFLLAAFFLLQKRRYVLAGVPMALAFTVKQSVWPLFPIYLAYLWFKTKSISAVLKSFSLFVLLTFLIVISFLIWDSVAFIDSTINYLSGSTEHSYPVSGYGFGMVLHSLGVIGDVRSYYPFVYWQLGVGIPVLVALILYLRRHLTVKMMIICYGIFLFVFWYFSRYLNNSHLGFLSVVFITAYFWPEKD